MSNISIVYLVILSHLQPFEILKYSIYTLDSTLVYINRDKIIYTIDMNLSSHPAPLIFNEKPFRAILYFCGVKEKKNALARFFLV